MIISRPSRSGLGSFSKPILSSDVFVLNAVPLFSLVFFIFAFPGFSNSCIPPFSFSLFLLSLFLIRGLGSSISLS